MSDRLKRAAAERAAAIVEDGMVVLGTGSTAVFAVEARAQGHRRGLSCVGISIAKGTEMQAISLGIKISDLKARPVVDLVVGGPDAVDLRSFSLTKGMGGALLREQIVACANRRMAVIIDPTKLAYPFGVPLPLQVVKFGRPDETSSRFLVQFHAADGRPKPTEDGNLRLDCYFGPTISRRRSIASSV